MFNDFWCYGFFFFGIIRFLCDIWVLWLALLFGFCTKFLFMAAAVAATEVISTINYTEEEMHFIDSWISGTWLENQLQDFCTNNCMSWQQFSNQQQQQHYFCGFSSIICEFNSFHGWKQLLKNPLKTK